MPFRYNVTMNDDLPAGLVGLYSRGAIVNGSQAATNTVTVHATHDFAANDKFLYALTRSNIQTDRVFVVTATTTTTVTFSGAALAFPDLSMLVPLGVDSGGVLQPDGSYSKIEWNGTDILAYKDGNGDSAYTLATVPVEPGGELGFWSTESDLWGISRNTGGKPVRVYILGTPTISSAGTNPQLGASLSLPRTPYAWYKADAITGLTNGANVSTWADLSGNNRHLTAGGVSGDGTIDAIRPKWYAATNSPEAGGTKMRSLPCVAFDGSTTGGHDNTGLVPYFSVDTGPLSLSYTSGWTIFMIVRDYTSAPIATNYFFGSDTLLGDSADGFVRGAFGTSSDICQWNTQASASIKYFCQNYVHTRGGDTEVVALRCEATNGNLRSWTDGGLQAGTGDTKAAAQAFRYIGRLNTAGSNIGILGKAIAELIFYDVGLSDGEVAQANDYLLQRIAGYLSEPSLTANVGTCDSPSATSGDDTPCAANTIFVGSIFVPAPMRINGIQYLVGSIGGTNNVIASLHSSSGTLLAYGTSTTVGTAALAQQLPLTFQYTATGPAWYFIGLNFNGATPRFRTVGSGAGNGVLGNGIAQTFGTPVSFTAPTTFTVAKVPIASIY